MSSTLTLYALSWADIEQKIGSGDLGLYKKIIDEQKESFFSTVDNEDCANWEKALLALILNGKTPSSELSDAEGLAFASLISTLGKPIATLQHRNGFSDTLYQFLNQKAHKYFQSTFDLSYLLQRVLFHKLPSTTPLWGGLKKEEIKMILSRLPNEEALPLIELDYEAEWFFSLWEALQYARETEIDIVSLYT